MSNIKNLFNKGQSNKLVSNSNLSDLGREIESPSFVKSRVKQIKKFIPDVNFSTASNFSVYGLAEEYYKNSIDYITNEYPYDGSRKEKIDWELSGTYVDGYFFDKLYPRTNGYVNIGHDYGTVVDQATIFSASANTEYIKFYSGPNQAAGYDSSQKIPHFFTASNVYATGSKQDVNIDIDGDQGFSVEFWLKKDGWSSTDESTGQIILDVWNSSSVATDRGQFTIYADRRNPDRLYCSVTSGSVNANISLGTSLPITDGNWNHYALVFKNEGSNLKSQLYLNSKLNATDTSISTIGNITGSVFGYIGAMTRQMFSLSEGAEGRGKLSGSLDDFRIWKSARTQKSIIENWFTSLNGGSNSDYKLALSSSMKFDLSNPVDLGIYFKFNEGIINNEAINSQDQVVLDYAGRTSNGSWTGYSVGSRQTGSAMVLSNAAQLEFKDPIIYSDHPLVSSLKTEYTDQGKLYDAQNNSALYWSLPSWITTNDQSKSNSQLKRLTQIIGSKFDELQLQISSIKDIKDRSFKLASSGSKPPPFMSEILRSYGLENDEILSNATQLEYLASRNETENFEQKLNDTKNLIYLNLYNNLVDIYKSKGTEKAFRNLIRCFGIDESIVNLNLYGSNVDYELRENEKYSVVRKKAIDFFDPSRFSATIYQERPAPSSDQSEVINFTGLPANIGSTFECQAFFKPNPPTNLGNSFSVNFLSSSVFGAHTTNASSATWLSPDVGNFQIYSVRKDLNRNEAFFVLTGTAGGFMPELTSSVFKDVYGDSKWNLSLRVYPEDPFVGSVSGSTTSNYVVRFTGFQYILDDLVNTFDVSSTISDSSGRTFLQADKRMFVGAHKTNFTSTLLEKCNAQIASCRVWAKKIENEQLKIHAKDPFNFGVKSPGSNQFISISGSQLGKTAHDIPDIKTLAMNWDFETISGSDSAGRFVVPDYSSGSATISGYSFLDDITQMQHPGYAQNFPAETSTAVVTRKFVNSSIQKKPEVINSSNMVSIVSETDDELFTRTSRPIDYYFSFEKSMYNVISQDMLNMFATIVDFNNIIGEPVYRYRPEYKNLEKLRQLYFQNVDNDPDFEKFLEYYKWIDASISTMLMQLAPASANFLDGMKNMVESHVLERNKYWTKFPTIDKKVPVSLEALALSMANQKTAYDVSKTGAEEPSPGGSGTGMSVDASLEEEQGREHQASLVPEIGRIATVVEGGDEAPPKVGTGKEPTPSPAPDRKNYKSKSAYLAATVGGSPIIYDGGSNPNGKFSKVVDYTKDKLQLGESNTLSVPASQTTLSEPKNEINKTLQKGEVRFPLEDSIDPTGYGTIAGNIAAPFSMYSSSAESGYINSVRDAFNPTDNSFPAGLTASADITNYHDDSYGRGGIPIQGPFTREHVGGRQARHQGIVTSSISSGDLRGEAWNLGVASDEITISSREYDQARAIYFRDGMAKRPVNIANIKYGSGSAVVGNYSNDYEVLETSGRTINNRYYVKSEGATLSNASSSYVKNLFDYELPRYDLTGSNKYIFVNRFSAPGGPETTAGGLNIHGGEFSVYNTINYRNLSVRNSLNSWYTEHAGRFGIKSGTAVSADDYNTVPAYQKVNRNPRHVIKEDDNCAVIYDNWWVQHAIPQSVFQYSWVTASVSKSACDTFGYVTPFTVPSGITSVTQSAVPFISQSYVNVGGIAVDFVGLNTLINDPVISGLNTISSSTNTYKNTAIATLSDGDVPNSLFLHRNGPYQYPSWKQIRTGQNPIARLHRKNNILSVAPSAQMINVKDGDGPGIDSRYLNTRPDVFKNFIQPPVSFKNKSLVTTVADLAENESILVHSYGSNNEYFSQPIGNTGSVSDYIGFEEPESEQFYDEILDSDEISVKENHYGEIIYPRDGRTGLAQTRTRVNYSEVATVTDNSASFSTGSNGIDRGPLLRRSFWKDDEEVRNRRIFFEGTAYGPLNYYSASPALTSAVKPNIATTLPNSQGYLDGAATSIYGMGRTPLTFCDTIFTASLFSKHYYAPQSLFPPASGSTAKNEYGIFDPGPDFMSGTAHMLSFFPDTGELNSANWQTIAGYIGISSGSSTAGSWANQTTLYPTASSYYYHRSKTMGNGNAASLNKLSWRTPELSGKNPWYNSYEDYTQDISKVAKDFTIIPEFKISDHMNYYSEFNFRKNNDKFLILHGANITSSAVVEEQPDGTRSFNEAFFNEYSNTDFQQYFGKFSSDLELGRISLTCNGVKKLLPYMGFYPTHRTLQLSSLFSQSLGPHISGLGWRDGQPISSSYENSGALAVQSMLQPYYAPGILYNTIKSGVACDWGAYTSSFNQEALTSATNYGIALAENSNYRIPFESILDPVSNIGIPSNDDDIITSKLELLYPTYTGLNHPSNGAFETSSRAFPNPRKPFAYLTSESRNKILSSDTYNLYRLGINNFLAEVPKFFLDEQKLKSIKSKRQDEISLVSGTAYYMNVTLDKDESVVMIEDYLNKPNNGQPTSITQYRTYNGRYFGPPLEGGPTQAQLLNTSCSNFYDPIGEFGFLTFFENAGDPLYAQYTPPYFYGKSKATIKYVADDEDEKGNFSYKKLFEKANVTYENEGLNNTLTKLQKRSELIYWVTSSVSGTFECAATSDHAGEYFVLSRSTGASSWDVFGATSSVNLPVTTSQYLEWQTLSTDKNYMVGLNNNPPSASTYTDMEYAMQISNDGKVNAWENGTNVYLGQVNTYSLNDWFRIRIDENNAVFYEICKSTSRADSVYPNGNPRIGDTDIDGTGPKTLYKYGDPSAWETLFMSNTSSNAYSTLLPDVSMEQISASLAYAQVGTNSRTVYPVEKGAMQLSSSLNTFGILTEKQSRFDQNGELLEVVDAPDENRNRWIISPKMETPVLDFSNQPRIEQDGRGMWSGYGQLLTASNGVTFGIEETFKEGFGPQSGSLVQKCFEAPQLRKIGEIADVKKISEAIVAIPYSPNSHGRNSKYAETTPVLDRNFFRIKARTFDFYKKWYESNKNGNLSTIPVDKKGNPKPSESITKMLSIAGDYVLPPEIDFMTYDSGRTKINPFVMYIFEFNHYLDAQDLADIWQGVMPKISTDPEFSDPAIDNNVFSHVTGKDEFYHGKELPPDTRWMVFKIKRRAGYNYFEVTPTNSDDEQFNLAFSLGKDNKLKYSYNWPYDFFSLVELAQVQTENTFTADEDQIDEENN